MEPVKSFYFVFLKKTDRRISIGSIVLLLCLYSIGLSAQCNLDGRFFSVNERLNYDIHFNWKFVWIKAGEAKILPVSARYGSVDSYKTRLTAKTTGAAKNLMHVRDTLTSYVTSSDLSPLFYIKAAHEGKTYSYEEIYYDYSAAGRINARLKHWRNNDFRGDTTLFSKRCFYDPVALLYYIRSLDPAKFTVNQSISIPVLFTDESFDVKITFRGKETINVNDEKISTVKYSFAIDGKAFEDKKESLFVWVSNDDNRIPVRIESKLKVGSIKASLKTASGCKNPASAFPARSKMIINP